MKSHSEWSIVCQTESTLDLIHLENIASLGLQHLFDPQGWGFQSVKHLFRHIMYVFFGHLELVSSSGQLDGVAEVELCHPVRPVIRGSPFLVTWIKVGQCNRRLQKRTSQYPPSSAFTLPTTSGLIIPHSNILSSQLATKYCPWIFFNLRRKADFKILHFVPCRDSIASAATFATSNYRHNRMIEVKNVLLSRLAEGFSCVWNIHQLLVLRRILFCPAPWRQPLRSVGVNRVERSKVRPGLLPRQTLHDEVTNCPYLLLRLGHWPHVVLVARVLRGSFWRDPRRRQGAITWSSITHAVIDSVFLI